MVASCKNLNKPNKSFSVDWLLENLCDSLYFQGPPSPPHLQSWSSSCMRPLLSGHRTSDTFPDCVCLGYSYTLTTSLSPYLLLAWIFRVLCFVSLKRSWIWHRLKLNNILASQCWEKRKWLSQLPTYYNQDFTLKLWIYGCLLKNQKIWQQLDHIPLLQPSAGAE